MMEDLKKAPSVTQADRERMASIEPIGRERDQILRGKRNKSPLLHAFARHREASTAELRAENERLLRQVERLSADNIAYRSQCKDQAARISKLAGALEAQPPISPDAGSWWYPHGDTSSDVCCFSPDEVVEGVAREMNEGDKRVIVIERALQLPDVYGLIRVFTEAEKEVRGDDEPWSLELYATDEEAQIALSTQTSAEDASDTAEPLYPCEACGTSIRECDDHVNYADGVNICRKCDNAEGGE